MATEKDTLDEAIEGGVTYLIAEGTRWFEGDVWVQDGSGCVSCHHVGYGLWAQHEAERAGLQVAEEDAAALAKRAAAFLAMDDRARVVSSTQMIFADVHTDIDLETLVQNTTNAGHWRARGQFPSQKRGEAEGDAVASLWALAAIAEFNDQELVERRERALLWLRSEQLGVSAEWTAARLVVAVAYGAQAEVSTLVERLVATQGGDGGWSWLEGDPSSVFATGQVVYALAVAGDKRADAALKRGAAYLLRVREADATWSTPSALVSAEPTKQKDYIYRYWSTAWATLALARMRGHRLAPEH